MNPKIRRLFPAAEKYTYLNSAAVSPLPTIAVDAVISQLRDVSENGTLHMPEWIKTKKRTRELVADLLKVKSEQIAFLRNTSDGISTIANGLDWAEGENIVTFEREFPSNFYPWRRIRDHFGVEIRSCPEIDGRMDVEEFLGLIDGNTKVVAISAVQFGSGYRADLERIGKAARAVDALFCVDMIQAFGAMPLDLEAMYVDAACGSSHKWLCSPEGCGIIYLGERAQSRVEPTLIGWISVDEPFNFNDTEQPWKPNALALESGTGNSSLFYGMEQSLKLLGETGIEKIAAHLEELTDFLCELLAGKDYEIVSSRAKDEKSQIVCIKNIKGLESGLIASFLEHEGIIISPRGDRLRIAPHLFNNHGDIEKLVEVLP